MAPDEGRRRGREAARRRLPRRQAAARLSDARGRTSRRCMRCASAHRRRHRAHGRLQPGARRSPTRWRAAARSTARASTGSKSRSATTTMRAMRRCVRELEDADPDRRELLAAVGHGGGARGRRRRLRDARSRTHRRRHRLAARRGARRHARGCQMSSHLFPEVSAHLLAATPTCHFLEYVDWADKIVEQPLRIVDGHAVAPDRPGNGLSWDKPRRSKDIGLRSASMRLSIRSRGRCYCGPLPLRERAAPTLNAFGWVRGNRATPPHPFFVVDCCGCPLPQGERAQQQLRRARQKARMRALNLHPAGRRLLAGMDGAAVLAGARLLVGVERLVERRQVLHEMLHLHLDAVHAGCRTRSSTSRRRRARVGRAASTTRPTEPACGRCGECAHVRRQQEHLALADRHVVELAVVARPSAPCRP